MSRQSDSLSDSILTLLSSGHQLLLYCAREHLGRGAWDAEARPQNFTTYVQARKLLEVAVQMQLHLIHMHGNEKMEREVEWLIFS